MSTPSDRSRLGALILGVPLGFLGAHRFYAGKIGTGILWFCTGGAFLVGWIVDVVRILDGSFEDAEGRKLSRWVNDEAMSGVIPGRLAGEMREEIEQLRAEVEDLNERVDFTERLLTGPRPQDPREMGPLGS